jgi:translation initiation factor 1A
MKRRAWIRKDDYVLVAPWQFQNKRDDILWRYRGNQLHLLEDKGLIDDSLRF